MSGRGACCATPAALLGLFFHFLGHILGPLIVWLMKRGDSPEIDAYGKESLNFQISMLIYDAIAAILCLVLIGIPILDRSLGVEHGACHHRISESRARESSIAIHLRFG